jgi:protease-4
MKKGTYVVIIILVFVLLFAITVVSFFYLDFSRPPAVRSDSYLEIGLNGTVQDLAMPDFLMSVLSGFKPLSLHDIWTNLRKAKTDDRIHAVLLRLGSLGCDWAKVSEIREAVLDFRSSGKKVLAYVEEAPEFDKEYYLATACDRIILHPMGWVGINGIGGYVPFFKKAFDKLGIRAEFEHLEEYKTAYNDYTEDRFTGPHREMIESIYKDIFSEYIKTVARARKKSEEEVRELIDRGFFYGEEALKAGVVDDLLYEDELPAALAEKGRRIYKISLNEYARAAAPAAGLSRGRKIALIYGQGTIIPGESFTEVMGGAAVSRCIRKAREDSSISAIVFRVDSPGGSAVASDVIGREVVLARKVKPVVISMSDMAGSGGYWIAMAGHKIVAQPQTLTGSIGVISGKFSLAGLYEKLGITAERVAFGEKADIFSSFRGLKNDEKKLLREQNTWYYEQFMSRVAENRNMTKEQVHAIAKGRVWTGNQAKEIGLVDEIGGLSRAIEIAKKLAGIPQDEAVKLEVWPKRASFLGSLFSRNAEIPGILLPGHLDKVVSYYKIMEKERIWALMPFWSAIQ